MKQSRRIESTQFSVKRAMGHTIHRKLERKGLMDIVSDIERRAEGWKY